MKILHRTLFVLALAALGAANSLATAQSPRIAEISHPSRVLKREVSFKVLLPADYARAEKNYPVLYLLHGLGGNHRNWTDKTELVRRSENLELIIIMPDGGNGWYSDSVSEPNEAYEKYVVEELIPFVEGKWRAKGLRETRFIAGLSMGGFGAIKFGLKRPDLFSMVGSFSGALDAPSRGEGNAFLRPSIMKVFGPSGSERTKSDDLFVIVGDLPPDGISSLPFIYFDCGTEDWLIETNRSFSALLLSKKIPHEFRQLPGRHDWKYWDVQGGEFLRLLTGRGMVETIGQ